MHIACMGDKIDAYKFFFQKPEGRVLFGISKCVMVILKYALNK
jgi:hypothetical protein